MAKNVSLFWTNNWIRWTMLNNQMSDECEDISSEISASIFAVERGDVEAPGLDHVPNCTRSRISFRLVELKSVAYGFGDDLLLVILDSLLRAELDSSLDSIDVSASIGYVKFKSASLFVFRRG